MEIKINDKTFEVEANKTILEVALANNIKIPTLCFLKEINEIGSCRICVVEVKKTGSLVASCVTKVVDGMEIYTDSPRVIASRKQTLKLILENHNYDCENCPKNGKCDLQRLVKEYNIEVKSNSKVSLSEENNAIIRDNSKCILCNRCVAICTKIQGLGVIGRNDRGLDTTIGCEFNKPLSESICVKCGQCVKVCPTGALTVKSDLLSVKKLLKDKKVHKIVALAPAVRTSLGEEFGLNENVLGKTVTALKKLGFDRVFDVNLTADLTIMEEANELMKRLKKQENLPLFTSCCPAWVKFIKDNYPELRANLSTSKSPQQMFGAVMKTYYALKNNIEVNNIKVVTIMPCTAKKDERLMDQNIDAVLTTSELAQLIKESSIKFEELKDTKCDPLFGEGHSVIFGTSGGVMETALRTAKEIMENKKSPNIDFHEVRGLKGIKEATYEINGQLLNVAVVSGLINAREIIKSLKNNNCNYHFIEVMSCPGGCINGGGQPYNNFDSILTRSKILYQLDQQDLKRRAHENDTIKEMYADYFGCPGSEKAEKILHVNHLIDKK